MQAMRNEKGQFVKGTSGNPNGRPKREVEALYLNAMIDAVPVSEWQKVVNAMIKQAQRGNVAAAAWLSNYLQGKPQDSVDITSDGEKLNLNVKWGDGSEND